MARRIGVKIENQERLLAKLRKIGVRFAGRPQVSGRATRRRMHCGCMRTFRRTIRTVAQSISRDRQERMRVSWQ
jgi:hypothetical protein